MFDNNEKSETFYDLDKFKCPSCNNIFDATCYDYYTQFKCDKCGQKFESHAQCDWAYDVWTFHVTIVD